MDKIESIKNRAVKQAIRFNTGGIRPSNSMSESWIGKIYLYKQEEEIPKDKDGKLMIPLLQLCLSELPFVPDPIKSTKVITVFISEDLPMDLVENGNKWVLREYETNDEYLVKELVNDNSYLKPYPLKPEILYEDYPVWDGGGLSSELEDEIIDLEKSGIIESYYDITENQYGHKVGGYPSFCQPGINFGEGYEFVLQIASDNKAMLNIVDGGTIFLAKNSLTNKWKFYCDFY